MYVVFSVTIRLCHHSLFDTASGAVIRRAEIITQLNLFLAVRRVNIAVNTMRIIHMLLKASMIVNEGPVRGII